MPFQGSPGDCSSPASSVSSNPCSPEGGSGQRSSRQRLRPWLEAQVESGKHAGLTWIQRDRGIFRMTWKHGGRADWSEEDGSIFKAWAVHTGRHREGVDDPDWPTWKTRLRCAINKLKPDIQEIKEMSCSEEPNPFRVFQFVRRHESGCSRSPPRNVSSSSCEEGDMNRGVIQDRPSVIQPNKGNIPTIVRDSLDTKPSMERHEECVDSIRSDFGDISITELVPMSNVSLTNISMDSKFSSYGMDTDSMKDPGSHQMNQQIKMEPMENTNPAYLQSGISDCEMLVVLRFRNEVIYQERIVKPHGCRVFYEEEPFSHDWEPEVIGSREARQILVPYQPGQLRSEPQDQYTRTVLAGLERGVSIVMDKRNIFLQRRCKTRIMTALPNKEHTFTQKVEREERLKVFDFMQDFLPAFLQYQQGEGPRPSPQVVIAVGQDFHTNEEPYTNLFFSVTVCHAQASHLLMNYAVDTTLPQMSDSDHFDNYMTIRKNEKALTPMVGGSHMGAPEPVYEGQLPLMQ